MTARRFPIFFAWMLTVLSIGTPASCQTVATSGEGTAAAHVPEFALVAVRLKLPQVLRSPSFEMMPIEIAQAWCQENLGLNLQSVEEIKLIVSMPAGPGKPPVGCLITTTQKFDPAKIDPQLLAEPEPKQVGSRQVYLLGDQHETAYLHAVDDHTLLITTPAMLEPMAAEAEGTGPLAELIRANPIGDAHLQIVAAIEPARPMLSQAARQSAQQLPPPMQNLRRVPELLDALVVKAQFIGRGTSFGIEMFSADETTASQLLDIFKQSINFGREMAVSQMDQEAAGDGPLAESQRAYARRFTGRIAEMITPEQDGNRLVIDGQAGASAATTGVLVALLLPAVQAAREAARRTEAANNLKQIAIALHNYHDGHGHFPPSAIVGDDGTPLLSWRVAILPYLEQQALYDQFHLDEPWDSAHNIKLAATVVAVYTDPSVVTEPGYTVFQAAVGDDYAFTPEGIRIADISDGTANTIMVVETDASVAVPWTAPRDIKIDHDNPLMEMGHTHPGGFQVMFADGSIHFLAHSIAPEVFRGLLTRSGGEAVGIGF